MIHRMARLADCQNKSCHRHRLQNSMSWNRSNEGLCLYVIRAYPVNTALASISLALVSLNHHDTVGVKRSHFDPKREIDCSV